MNSRLLTIALAIAVALSSVSIFGQEGRRGRGGDDNRDRGGNRGGGGGGNAGGRREGGPPAAAPNPNRGGGGRQSAPPNANRGGGPPAGRAPNINRGGSPPQRGPVAAPRGGPPAGAPNMNRGGSPQRGPVAAPQRGPSPPSQRNFQAAPRGGPPAGAPNLNRGGSPQRGPVAGQQPSQRNFQASPRGGGQPDVRGPNVQRQPSPAGQTTVGRPNFDRGNRPPNVNRPNVAQPNNPQPNLGRTGRPNLAQPGGPGAGRPDLGRPGGSRPGNDGRPNLGRPDGGRPDLARPDRNRPGNQPGAERREVNRPNLDPPGNRPNIDRDGSGRPNFVDRNRNQGPNRGPGNPAGPDRIGGPRGDGDRRVGDGRGPRDGNRPDGGAPNFVDRNRDRDGRGPDGRDRDGRGPDGRDRDGRGPDGRDRDGRGPDGRDRDVAGPDRGDRDRDFRDRDGRGRDSRDFRDRDGRGGRDGRPGGSRDNFVGRNFRGQYANFINGGQNWNNSWNRRPNWQNYGGDWRRSNWYGNYWGGGYRPRYSPWWGVVPGLGWNWGGWGWGYGWPQWGYGYGGWGGYGYGYGVGATYLQAPTTTVVYTPTVQQIEVAQDFYNLAVEAFQAGRYDDAVQYCQHAMVDNPQSGEIILLMAQSLSALGQYDRAADAVRMAIEVLPEEQWGTVVADYSRYYPEVQQYTDQLRKLEAEARQSGAQRPELNFLLGYNYAYLNYPPQAVAQLDKTLDRQPQDTAAQKLRNHVAAKAGIPARQVDAAAQQAAAAPPAPAEQQPQTLTADAPTEAELDRAAGFIAEGEEAMKAGQYREALSHWQHALVETPQNGGAILLVAQALFALGQFNDAAGAVQMGMQLLPEEDWGIVVKNFAQLYSDPAEYAKQLKALEEARGAKADDPALRFLSGYQYGFLGHRDQAVRELDKALQLQPQDQGAKKLREMFAAQQSPVPVEGAPAPGE